MTADTFYFSFSTGKIYNTREEAQEASVLRKPVLKPRKTAFAPTRLDDYWFTAAVSAIQELDAWVQLAGDDERDEFAEERGLDSDALGSAASVLLNRILQQTKLLRNLHRAVKERPNYDHITAWIVQVLTGLLDQGGTDWIDNDELRVLRQIAKYLAAR